MARKQTSATCRQAPRGMKTHSGRLAQSSLPLCLISDRPLGLIGVGLPAPFVSLRPPESFYARCLKLSALCLVVPAIRGTHPMARLCFLARSFPPSFYSGFVAWHHVHHLLSRFSTSFHFPLVRLVCSQITAHTRRPDSSSPR